MHCSTSDAQTHDACQALNAGVSHVKEEAPQWSAAREAHAVDMHVMKERWHGFILGVIGLTAYCTEDFFRLSLVLSLAGTKHLSHVRPPLACVHAGSAFGPAPARASHAEIALKYARLSLR